MDALNALLTCESKDFGQMAENVSLMLQLFWTKCKNLAANVQKKKKKVSHQKSSKKLSGLAKSLWEVTVAEAFAKKN